MKKTDLTLLLAVCLGATAVAHADDLTPPPTTAANSTITAKTNPSPTPYRRP